MDAEEFFNQLNELAQDADLPDDVKEQVRNKRMGLKLLEQDANTQYVEEQVKLINKKVEVDRAELECKSASYLGRQMLWTGLRLVLIPSTLVAAGAIPYFTVLAAIAATKAVF